ncbi:MAG TPA: maleylpyruvate isomerase family mycothiol-dependent enzyme [Streptosporangiaceae bacterium]
MPEADLRRLYRDTRERVAGLLAGMAETALAANVPACPSWSVRDVLAHLTAVAEDVVAGRLSGPPTEEETAAQVRRFAGRPVADILERWAGVAPRIEELIGSARVWPGVIDVASHEQDIRGAVGQPGARDSDAIWQGAGWLLSRMRPPVPLRVVVEDAEFRLGPGTGTPLTLTTTRFEAFRWRMGRRSRDQLAALGWSGDPAPVLGHLVVFGPATRDVIE